MFQSVPSNSAQNRIRPVDAARGCAMLLVFLSHTKHHFDVSAPELYWFLLSVTRIATPAFLLLSGFVVRHVLATDREGNASITLIDRALFLLIVAHSLIGLDSLPDKSAMAWFFDRTMITDAVGFALLFAVLLRNRSGVTLVALGIPIFVLSWLAASTLTLEEDWSQWLASVTVQWRGANNPDIDVPIVGYLGVFLLGMALHRHLERPLLREDYPQIARRLFVYGLLAVSVALLGVVAWHFGKDIASEYLTDATSQAHAREFFDPRGKRPPSLGYVAFYGGISLIILAILFRGKPTRLVQPIVRHASVIGRASLMCFVVQDWLLLSIPRVVGFDGVQSVAFWLIYLAVATAMIYSLARFWGRIHGNRFLTVGLKALVLRRRAAARQAAAAKKLAEPRTFLP